MSMLKMRKYMLVGCLSVVIAGAGGCARTPMQKRDRFLEAGAKQLQRKAYSRAILEFKNAVAAMPRDPEPYYQLGRAFVASQELQSAVYSFRRAIELNPKHAGAQLELSKIMASTIDPEILHDAESRLTTLLQGGAADQEALQTLALTQLKLGEIDSAINNLQQAISLEPGSLGSSVLMAQAKLAQRDFKGAEAALQEACSKAPKSSAARVVLGNFYLSRNRLSEAEQQFRQALDINPKEGAALLQLGKIQVSGGRKQEAEATFRRLSSLPDPGTKPVHALFLLQEGRKDEAVREFEQLAKSDPTDRAARTRLVSVYQTVGRKQDAVRTLQEALKKNPKDMDALLQRGELYLAEGKFGLAETDLNQVLREKPNSAEVHYVLAKVNQARGSTLVQRQELSEALRLNPMSLRLRLELAQLLLDNNGAKAALGVLNEAPAFQRQTLAVVVQRNWTLWALGDLNELKKGIDQGLAAARLPDLLIQDGLLKLRQGDFNGARGSLEEALRINPQDLRALEIIRRSYVAQNQMSVAVQKVKQYAAAAPRSAAAQEFLGNVLMASGDKSGARAAFEAAKAADGKLEQAEMSLIQLDFSEGKIDSAKSRLRTVLSAKPNDAQARLWLGDVEATVGDNESALKSYQQVLDIEPAQPQALNNAAYLLADYHNRPDEGLKYAEKAHELVPDNPDYSDTLGWILYRKGVYDSAIKHLEAASRGGNVISQYHLAMAYAKAGQSERARATLEAALKTNPKVPEAKTAAEVVGANR